tara:strand:- start:347 stop:481 length:135 start_codon:yes stop_codon:yes gene_type:complete
MIQWGLYKRFWKVNEYRPLEVEGLLLKVAEEEGPKCVEEEEEDQ